MAFYLNLQLQNFKALQQIQQQKAELVSQKEKVLQQIKWLKEQVGVLQFRLCVCVGGGGGLMIELLIDRLSCPGNHHLVSAHPSATELPIDRFLCAGNCQLVIAHPTSAFLRP